MEPRGPEFIDVNNIESNSNTESGSLESNQRTNPESPSDERIKQRLEAIYQRWLEDDSTTRGPFSIKYIRSHGGGLYNRIRESGKNLGDFLQAEMVESHKVLREKWTEERIRERLEEIFQLWMRIDEGTRPIFGPRFVTQYAGALAHHIRVKSLDYLDYLSPTAQFAWGRKSLEEKSESGILPKVNEHGVYVDEQSNEWVLSQVFRDRLSSPTISNLFRNLPTKNVRTRGGTSRAYSKIEAEKLVDDYLAQPKPSSIRAQPTSETTPPVEYQSDIYVDQDGKEWVPLSYFSPTGTKLSNTILTALKNVSSIRGRSLGVDRRLFDKDAALQAIESHVALPQVDKESGIYKDENDQEWAALEYFTFTHSLDWGTIRSRSEKCEHIIGRDRSGRTTFLFNKQHLNVEIQKILELPQVNKDSGVYSDENGDEWVVPAFFNSLGVSQNLIEREIIKVRSINGRDKGGHEAKLYHRVEGSKIINEFLALPRVDKQTGTYTDQNGNQWATAEYFKAPGITSKRIAANIDEINSLRGRDRGGKRTKLYNVQELNEKLNRALETEAYSQEKQEEEKKTHFNEFIKDVSEGESVSSNEFRSIVSLFGASNVVDILYRYRPEYQGIPIEQVKSVIADYLGEFLVTKTTFNPPDLEQGISYLGEPNFREGLYEVIRSSCLDYYNLYKKQSPELSDDVIIQTYLTFVRTETARFANDDLNQVLDSIDTYFQYLILDTDKPARIIDELREGRQFPDLSQRINIKEITDKKRVLIADEMGGGKSASVILTKEKLGLKQALIMAPSNVISTWQGYLSDEKNEDGTPKGYFKEGQAPSTYIVDENSFRDGPIDLSEYEYILISHERLTEANRVHLDNLTSDMTIIDEVHKLKNVRSGVRATQAIDIAEKNEGEDKYCVSLSGTPVPNKIEDIAMILKLLYPERFKEVENKQLVSDILSADILDLRQLLLPRMQMKRLVESVDMPPLHEHLVEVELSESEKEMYEVIVEEDELEAHEKIRLLRQFLLNPAMLETVPVVEGAKFKAAEQLLLEAFETNDKVALFVNGYIQEILRGDHAILDSFRLPEDVEIRVIDGNTPGATRNNIQQEFKTSDKKILLAVSGQTADVGVDYSPAQSLAFYNEPWTKYDLRQQRGRVYRPGLEHALDESIFVVKGTLEEGIHHYIEAKERAIEKLLRGIPITELEKQMLKHSEDQSSPNVEVNPELARYYYSSWERLMRIFNHVREIGQENFQKFLAEHGSDYAESYQDLGSRSYQANANRIAGTLIDEMMKGEEKDVNQTWILDVASGPEMLRQHIPDAYQDRVFSLDINAQHFQKREDPKAVVGSFTGLPVRDKSLDYANLNLALHYTQFLPSRGNFERLHVLSELNRTLKEGGKAIINLIYSMDIRDWEKFEEIVQVLGFEIKEEYSGSVEQSNNYRSHMITLEKQADIDLTFDELKELLADDFDGLKFKRVKGSLKDSRRIITNFSLAGREIPIRFNEHDQKIWEEEQSILNEGESLVAAHADIAHIPPEEIVEHGFIRFYNGKRYVLFKRLESGEGYVVIK